jgi:hypothetical protein
MYIDGLYIALPIFLLVSLSIHIIYWFSFIIYNFKHSCRMLGDRILPNCLCWAQQHFSGLSIRRAGISAGLSARVQELVMFLQSGHGKGTAARNYMVPTDPRVWYEHFADFDL